MTLSVDTLAEALESMVPAETEAEGIEHFAAAFREYFAESVVGGVPAVFDALEPADTAMRGAMAGVVASNGPAGLTAGITAFWGEIPSIAAVVWVRVPVLATATPPPGLSGLIAAIAAAGTANIAGALSLEDSAAAMATAIHSCMTGGTATDTTAPTPVVFPIL